MKISNFVRLDFFSWAIFIALEIEKLVNEIIIQIMCFVSIIACASLLIYL